MAKLSKNAFVVLWLGCAGIVVLAGGTGRTMEGKPFFAQYHGTLQNIFYGIGVVIFGLVLGWLLAKLVQRVIG